MRTSDLFKALKALDQQGRWLITRNQLRVMFPGETEDSLRESVGRHIKNGYLIHVAQGLYANPSPSFNIPCRLSAIVSYLRPLDMNYISAETALELAEADGSYNQRDLIVVMTTGRSYCYETPFGAINFIHTKRNLEYIKSQCGFDLVRKIYVANAERARGDMRRTGRVAANA